MAGNTLDIPNMFLLHRYFFFVFGIFHIWFEQVRDIHCLFCGSALVLASAWDFLILV